MLERVKAVRFVFHSDETDLPQPQGLTTLESFYKHFAAEVAGMTVLPGETLRELETRHYNAEPLSADLADIEKKISSETQVDRKYALAKEKSSESLGGLCRDLRRASQTA